MAWGDAVGPYANTLWHLVTWNTQGTTIYIADTYLDTPNNANESTPGEAFCGAAPTPVVSPPSPISVTPGCLGDACSGQSPLATRCADDAVTVDWVDLIGARLELRWSAACQTNWAKFIRYPQGWAFLANNFGALYAIQDTGYTQHLDLFTETLEGINFVMDGSITVYWSPMIYSPVHLVKAQLLPACSSPTVGGCVMDMITGERPETGFH
jgi:hypothetical protein